MPESLIPTFFHCPLCSSILNILSCKCCIGCTNNNELHNNELHYHISYKNDFLQWSGPITHFVASKNIYFSYYPEENKMKIEFFSEIDSNIIDYPNTSFEDFIKYINKINKLKAFL